MRSSINQNFAHTFEDTGARPMVTANKSVKSVFVTTSSFEVS